MTHERKIYNVTIGRSWHVMTVWAKPLGRLHAIKQGLQLANQFGRAALRRLFRPGTRGSLTVLSTSNEEVAQPVPAQPIHQELSRAASDAE